MSETVRADRTLTVVIGYDPSATAAVRREVRESGLAETVALVMATHPAPGPDLFLDHALWAACTRAVTQHLEADETDVLVDSRPSLLDRLLRRIPSRPFGSLTSYAEALLQDPELHLWQAVRWRRHGILRALALHEAWWRVGGADSLYHDSYTTCIFVSPATTPGLVDVIRAYVREEGGHVDEVVDLRSIHVDR